MERFVGLLIKFRWFIVVATPLIAFVCAYLLKDAAFDGSYRIWFAPESQTLKRYDLFKERFGNDDSMIILFRDEEGIFTPKALGVVERLTQKLWQTPYIARVDSITNYQYVHVEAGALDDVIVESFIEDVSRLSSAQLDEKKRIALQEDMLLGRIISEDAKTTMIVARITPKGGRTIGASRTILEALEGYLQEEHSSGYVFHLAGGPVVNQTFASLALHDVSTFTPLSIVIAMAVLYFVLRRMSAVSMTLLVVIFTFTIVMALQVLFGYKFNNFTANMPVFIIAIGIADAMHLIWVYILERRGGMSSQEAIFSSVRKNFLPLFLTSLTTAVGFASLGISNILPVATLGIATATGAIIAFVLTITFVPALLSILALNITPSPAEKSSGLRGRFLARYVAFVLANERRIIALFSLMAFGIALGITQLQIDSNAVRYFREDVAFVKSVQFIEEELTGPLTYEVVADSLHNDGIKEPAFMKCVERFSQEFLARFDDARHAASLVDVVKRFNELLASSKSVPSDKNLIAQYLLLYSLSLPQGMEINDKMDIDERRLRISLSMNVSDTSKDLEMIAWIENWWSKTPYGVEVTGQSAMFAKMQQDVTETLVNSTLIALGVICVVMAFVFKNLRMIPVFLIPNLLPILLVLGVMGWLGMRVDIGIAISGAIILGIAVDDTIHFLLKYQEARREAKSVEASLLYVMRYGGGAMLFTTLTLCCAFFVFSFSQFMLNAHFGLLCAIALSLALAVDLLLLPAVLSRIDRAEPSKLI